MFDLYLEIDNKSQLRTKHFSKREMQQPQQESIKNSQVLHPAQKKNQVKRVTSTICKFITMQLLNN